MSGGTEPEKRIPGSLRPWYWVDVPVFVVEVLQVFLANVEKMQHDRQKVGYILRLAAGLGTVHRASQRVSHSAGPNGTTHRLAVWAVMTTEHI